MKLEWGKKISCPKCATNFFDMMKKSLTCPNCNASFENTEVRHKNAIHPQSIDDIDLDDKIVDISGFDLLDDGLHNVNELASTSDFSDIKERNDK